MKNFDQEKEQMIHELLELKKQRNKDIDETVNLIDKADSENELMEALVNSPLGKTSAKINPKSTQSIIELHKSLNGLKDKLSSIIKDKPKEEKIKPTNTYKDKKLQYAYEMGFDSAVNGANKINCSVYLFLKEDSKQAWEHGEKRGLEIKKLKGLI